MQAKPRPSNERILPDDGMPSHHQIGLRSSWTSKLVSRVSLKSFLRLAVMVEVFMFLPDHTLLQSMSLVNKWCYRLARDNAMWRRRLYMTHPAAAYVSQVLGWRYKSRCSHLSQYQCKRTARSLSKLAAAIPLRGGTCTKKKKSSLIISFLC